MLQNVGGELSGEIRLTVHLQELSPRSPEAINANWPRFNGPNDNAISPETKISTKWDSLGPKLAWELVKGEGYASPAIQDGILVLFHRMNGMEMVEALHAENGTKIWNYEYPVNYRDRYGYSNGPRASPVIHNGRVYLHGVTAWLTCLDLKTGKLIWNRNLKDEFKIPEYFFGKGSNPLVLGKNLIVNIGGANEACVVSFDLENGKTRWIARSPWGASYSSPVAANITNKTVCLVFAGGESRPPAGGLLVIEPNGGKILSEFPWRSSKYESANAVPPIPLDNNRVFLSECYEKGGVILQFDQNFKPKILWQEPLVNIHWMTPIQKDNLLFGIAGRHQQGAELFCLNLDTLTENWRKRVTWESEINGRNIDLELFRASMLLVDDKFICLSELGSLVCLELNKTGWNLVSQAQLFFAPGTWTLPAISNGLLYVMQNETDRISGKSRRLLCYDLRVKQ